MAAFEITRRRTEPAGDGSHDHIELVGILSPHTPIEPVNVDVGRILERMVLGEEFFVRAPDGSEAKVVEGKCEVCGHTPTLKTDKDPPGGNLILDLPYT